MSVEALAEQRVDGLVGRDPGAVAPCSPRNREAPSRARSAPARIGHGARSRRADGSSNVSRPGTLRATAGRARPRSVRASSPHARVDLFVPRPDDHRRPRSGERRADRSRRRSLANRGKHRSVGSAIRLVELVVERRLEERRTSRRERRAEERSARDRRSSGRVRDLLRQRCSSCGRQHALSGMTAIGTNGSVSARRAMWQSHVRQTPPASAAARLSACPSSGTPSSRSRSGSRSSPFGDGRGGQAERDDRGARAEPSLARDLSR